MPPNNTGTKQHSGVSVALQRNVPLNPMFRRPLASSRNLRREAERLKSFETWPVTFMDPGTLAADGFYYTLQGDVVRCAFCGVEIGCWEVGDDVRRDHVKWSESCDFVLGRSCGNIPAAEDDSVEEETESYDICGPYASEIRPFSGPERAVEPSTLWRDLEHLGVSKTSGPVTPYYSTYESRLASFDTWSASAVQRPEALAEAGFYYLKYHDHTVCFHCGGGLKDWEAEDDPWVEHARWFSKCGFILIQKGREYVTEVVSKNKAILSAKAVKELRPPVSRSPPETPEAPEALEAPELEPPSDVEPPPLATSPTTSSSSKSSSVKELELCRICYSQERSIVFLPCGHFVSCVKCAPSLSTCAVCRKPYEATVRAYLC